MVKLSSELSSTFIKWGTLSSALIHPGFKQNSNSSDSIEVVCASRDDRFISVPRGRHHSLARSHGRPLGHLHQRLPLSRSCFSKLTHGGSQRAHDLKLSPTNKRRQNQHFSIDNGNSSSFIRRSSQRLLHAGRSISRKRHGKKSSIRKSSRKLHRKLQHPFLSKLRLENLQQLLLAGESVLIDGKAMAAEQCLDGGAPQTQKTFWKNASKKALDKLCRRYSTVGDQITPLGNKIIEKYKDSSPFALDRMNSILYVQRNSGQLEEELRRIGEDLGVLKLMPVVVKNKSGGPAKVLECAVIYKPPNMNFGNYHFLNWVERETGKEWNDWSKGLEELVTGMSGLVVHINWGGLEKRKLHSDAAESEMIALVPGHVSIDEITCGCGIKTEEYGVLTNAWHPQGLPVTQLRIFGPYPPMCGVAALDSLGKMPVGLLLPEHMGAGGIESNRIWFQRDKMQNVCAPKNFEDEGFEKLKTKPEIQGGLTPDHEPWSLTINNETNGLMRTCPSKNKTAIEGIIKKLSQTERGEDLIVSLHRLCGVLCGAKEGGKLNEVLYCYAEKLHETPTLVDSTVPEFCHVIYKPSFLDFYGIRMQQWVSTKTKSRKHTTYGIPAAMSGLCLVVPGGEKFEQQDVKCEWIALVEGYHNVNSEINGVKVQTESYGELKNDVWYPKGIKVTKVRLEETISDQNKLLHALSGLKLIGVRGCDKIGGNQLWMRRIKLIWKDKSVTAKEEFEDYTPLHQKQAPNGLSQTANASSTLSPTIEREQLEKPSARIDQLYSSAPNSFGPVVVNAAISPSNKSSYADAVQSNASRSLNISTIPLH